MAAVEEPAAMPSPFDFGAIVSERALEAKTSLRCGEFLFREGDDADAFYIVTRGVLRIMSGSAIYETVQAGGIVGEMAIIDEGMPRSASVIAGTYAELIRIDPAEFAALIASVPEFALMVMRVMAGRLRLMNQRYRPQTVW
jgi:CRP/FNR family cyclic AMP-dependent transcriptional regulator